MKHAGHNARTPRNVTTGNGEEVGATPLSSSSLSNYYNAEGSDGNGEGALMEDQNGGIMNFIFRGAKSPMKVQTHGPGGPPAVVHLPQVPDNMKHTDLPPSERELTELNVIKMLIESYFNVVRKNFIDLVPKTIMFFLVNHCKDAMQNELVSELYREAEIPGLMKEAEDVAARRESCQEMQDLLGKALEIVNEVRDYNTLSDIAS